ncbi:hypothetical protein RFI_13937, partial [Reticulomyxa filosa]
MLSLVYLLPYESDTVREQIVICITTVLLQHSKPTVNFQIVVNNLSKTLNQAKSKVFSFFFFLMYTKHVYIYVYTFFEHATVMCVHVQLSYLIIECFAVLHSLLGITLSNLIQNSTINANDLNRLRERFKDNTLPILSKDNNITFRVLYVFEKELLLSIGGQVVVVVVYRDSHFNDTLFYDSLGSSGHIGHYAKETGTMATSNTIAFNNSAKNVDVSALRNCHEQGSAHYKASFLSNVPRHSAPDSQIKNLDINAVEKSKSVKIEMESIHELNSLKPTSIS